MSGVNQFEKYYLNEKSSDVVLIIDGNRIPCHKLVLSDKSLVFETMFYSEFKESNDKEIEIKDTSLEAFKVMLGFIYKQKIEMEDKANYLLALEVIQLSHRFQIQNLVDLFEEELVKMIEIGSFIDLSQTSKLLELKKLMNALKKFVEERDFTNYYLSEKLSDITLIIDGNHIPAHKFLLWSKSPVFENIISKQSIESSDNQIDIKDVSFEAFKVILKFIYKKEFVVNFENDYQLAIEVLKLSFRFQIKDLFNHMERALTTMLTIENFLAIFECYESFGLDSQECVSKGLKRFVRENNNQLIDFISFVGLSNETIRCFLSLFKSQTPVINVLNKMIAEQSEIDLKKFKKSIKFKYCSVEDMRALKGLNLFTETQFNSIWDRKYEKLSNQNEILKIENLNLQPRQPRRMFGSQPVAPQVDDSDSDDNLYYDSESNE